MTVMRAVYGIDLTESEDECFQMGETITRIGTEMFTPGAFPVDSIPVLRFLPSWFPGAGFKRVAALWREPVEAMFEGPLNAVREQLVRLR